MGGRILAVASAAGERRGERVCWVCCFLTGIGRRRREGGYWVFFLGGGGGRPLSLHLSMWGLPKADALHTPEVVAGKADCVTSCFIIDDCVIVNAGYC